MICWISFAVVLGLFGHASAAIPDGWSDRDIGTTGGSANEAGGTWTISGDGADIWDNSDAFHYAYLPLSGNGQITARVVSRGTGSNRWSKGGVMIRETLARGSKHAIMAITGGEGGGIAFQNRLYTGGRSFSAHGNPSGAPPYWVRLKREGDKITGYSSADGVDWVQQPDGTGEDATANPVDIQMATDVLVGLFVTSHAGGEVRTYTFDNVTVGLPSASSTATYYIDGGNPAARDTNPGSEARPWKTIGKATSLLRPGDTVFIKAGIYRETVILSNSGTKTKPIKVMAYPGDEGKAIINAAELVTNWQKCTAPDDCAGNPHWNHIYYADVTGLVRSHSDSAFAVRQVFQHGELLNRARYPDTGWSYPTSVLDPRTIFSDSSLSKPDGYFNGSVCHIKTEVWQPDQIDIVDYSGHTVTLSNKPRYDISTRFGYYITNTVGEINEEGEWAYDPALKRIFIWPKDDIAQNIEVTYRNFCVRTYSGVSSNEVRGLTMRNAYNIGIWLYGANDMWIEDNTVENSYDTGIYLVGRDGRCENNRIINNTVQYACYHGITVDGDSYDNNIEGNYVYAIGTEYFGGDLMHGRGVGIFIGGPFTRVYNNRVDRTGHVSLYLSGKASGREISYNYITNTCLALSDGGGIYMGGFSDEPETDYIHHNIFEDIIGCRSMEKDFDTGSPPTIETHSGAAPGIYVDEEGNNRIIENNTVINSHMAGIFFHWAPSNVVEKNTLYGNREAQVWFSGKDEARKILENDDIIDNIMFATDAQQKTFLLGINYDNVHFGQSDNNYFYNPYNYRHIFVSRYKAYEDRWTRDDLTLAGWRTLSGYDGDSKDFSYLNQFDDITIDSPIKSRIIYNPSLDAVSIDLKSEKYCDVDGNKIHGSVSLQPFESKILIFSDYEIPDPSLEGHLNKDGKIQ